MTFNLLSICLDSLNIKQRRFEFYIHGSVHLNSILIRSNKMQQHADIYLMLNYSTCFGCPSHPSSVVHKTVNCSFWPLGHAGGRLLPEYVIWPVPEAAVTVLCTPGDGCDGHVKHVE
jgi:hypothetical protein